MTRPRNPRIPRKTARSIVATASLLLCAAPAVGDGPVTLRYNHYKHEFAAERGAVLAFAVQVCLAAEWHAVSGALPVAVVGAGVGDIVAALVGGRLTLRRAAQVAAARAAMLASVEAQAAREVQQQEEARRREREQASQREGQ